MNKALIIRLVLNELRENQKLREELKEILNLKDDTNK